MKPRAFECVEGHKQFKSESSKEQHCKDKRHPPQQLNTDVFPCGRCSLKCSTVMELVLHSSTHVQTPTQHPYESVSNPYPPEIARRLEVLGIGRTYPFAQTTPELPWLIDACTQGRLPPRWVKTEAENYTQNSNSRANAGSLDVKGKGVDASRMKEKHRADKGRADTASHNTEPCPNDATSAQPTAIPRPAGMDKDTEVQCSQGFGKFRNAATLHDHCKAKEFQTEAASDFPPLPSKPAGLDSSVAHKPTVVMSNGSGIQCTICLVWVVDKADLARHWQERHAIKCRDCQTDFDTDRALEIHIRDTPNHICCSICNKTYRLKATLHYHISVNHVGQRPPAECLICNKGYKSVGVLEDHIAAIHRLDTRYTLQTIDGVAQYGTFPSSPASMPEPPVKPERKVRV
ncbi:hypothetical protein PHLGIDRAFT_419835 [Phlebiopsis gigantea 11061_1 CR5-6]|uniref:C2H2-type domain-containing protein n=1 Tax=Phlebiopsis gigantea (strain 11061_1 CR5-6) TaxID=745531 RepID=A0A0C3SDK8_PHLG1|nr:hypothetical protein PHLGIDRAFT_419835 [Phlebiopsis gigantea 11061_1 CR5-6]